MKKVKRAFDIIVSLILLVLFFPLLVIIAVMVLLDGTRGEVLADTPNRVGLNGIDFRMFKFRTMIPGSHDLVFGESRDDKLHKEVVNSGKIRTENDPRITKVGRILRKCDLDELPQLFNVLIGNMSLVGPRPYFREEIDRFRVNVSNGEELFTAILSMKPGITGPWQTSGRNDIPVDGRMKIEVSYARNWSLIKDVRIILRTPWVVISRKGAW